MSDSLYTQEMLDSIQKVEATRPSRIGFEPRRMTAEEKEALLAKFHPDYKKKILIRLSWARIKESAYPRSLRLYCRRTAASSRSPWIWSIRTMT